VQYLKRDEKDVERNRQIDRLCKDDPEFRESYGKAMEQAKLIEPQQMAVDRRFGHKQMRFQGHTSALLGKGVALRKAMEDRING
jgi:hypothetical protein